MNREGGGGGGGSIRDLGNSIDYYFLYPSRRAEIGARICVCVRARVCVCVYVCVCVCETYSYCLIGDNGRLQYLRSCLFEIYVSVGFVMFVQRSEFNSG